MNLIPNGFILFLSEALARRLLKGLLKKQNPKASPQRNRVSGITVTAILSFTPCVTAQLSLYHNGLWGAMVGS
jgi:hypothetical protein